MKYGLVMGASGDIGQACAESLAAAGWSVYCHYFHNEVKVKKLTESLAATYPQQDFFPVHLDMTQEGAITTFSEQLFQVDGIIFASGNTVYKLLTETSSAEMDQLWQVYVKTPMQICQLLQYKLAKQNAGRVVFIGSVYGIIGSSMEVVYSTLKGAQQAFAKAYAQEVASLGITVNVIAPGAVNTKMNEAWSAEERQALLSEIPVQRMAEPQEIAGLARFLLSQEAAYITGATIPISGGWKV